MKPTVEQILKLPLYFKNNRGVYTPITDMELKEMPLDSGKMVIVFIGEKK